MEERCSVFSNPHSTSFERGREKGRKGKKMGTVGGGAEGMREEGKEQEDGEVTAVNTLPAAFTCTVGRPTNRAES